MLIKQTLYRPSFCREISTLPKQLSLVHLKVHSIGYFLSFPEYAVALTDELAIFWGCLATVLVFFEGKLKVAKAAIVPLNTVPIHWVMKPAGLRSC